MARSRTLRTRLAVAWLGLGPAAVAQPPADPPAAPKKPLVPAPDPPPGTILAVGELPIDLGTALRLAGVENPDLLLARERVTEAAALRQLAAAQILPNLNGGVNYDKHIGPLQQSPGDVIRVNRDALYFGLGANAVAAGTVNVPGLYYNLNVGTAWFDALQARQAVAARAAAARAVEYDTLLRVCLGYCELLRAGGKRAVAGTNREEAAELARMTAAYAQTGQGRKADADRAAVELRKRDAELLQAEADMLTASAQLARLLNLDPSTRLKPIDGYAVPAPVVPDPTPLPDLIAVAVMRRPELAERRAEIQRALYALSSAELLPFSPNVILGFSAGGFGGGSNLVSEFGTPLVQNGQLTVQKGPRFGDFNARTDLDAIAFWTLQNFGVGNVAMIRQADSIVRQTRFRELETLNRVRAEVAEAHARAAAKFAQIEVAERAVKASTEAFREDYIRIRGEEGLPIEVVDSMRLLGRSRFEYLDAIIDYNRAQFQLFVSLGQPPADLLARPVPAELNPPQSAVPTVNRPALPEPRRLNPDGKK